MRKQEYNQKPKNFKKERVEKTEQSSDEKLILKGRHEVVQALESGQNLESIVLSTGVRGPIGGTIRELASKAHIPVKEMNSELFGKKFGDKSQGVAAIAGAFDYIELSDLIAIADKGSGIIVALNCVEDARNLGAIVRTVEASGCSGVVIPKHRSAGMTEWAIRTAQGAASILPVARVNNLGDAIEQLKEAGYWVYGLDGDGDKTYTEANYNGKVLLVAGGEDVGLGDRVKKSCDEIISIPLMGKTTSLNVSVSVAVALYEVLRQKNFFRK